MFEVYLLLIIIILMLFAVGNLVIDAYTNKLKADDRGILFLLLVAGVIAFFVGAIKK